MGLLPPHRASCEYPRNAKGSDTFGARLVKLGPLSLIALIAGGLILILAALNALLGPKLKNFESVAWENVEADLQELDANRFHVGQTWSVQVWLAIVGFGFALL